MFQVYLRASLDDLKRRVWVNSQCRNGRLGEAKRGRCIYKGRGDDIFVQYGLYCDYSSIKKHLSQTFSIALMKYYKSQAEHHSHLELSFISIRSPITVRNPFFLARKLIIFQVHYPDPMRIQRSTALFSSKSNSNYHSNYQTIPRSRNRNPSLLLQIL